MLRPEVFKNMIIEEKNGKIECFDEESKNKLIFDDLSAVKNFIENMSAKFDRFMKGIPGFEKRLWFGFYTTCDNEHQKSAFEIMKKHEEMINLEFKEAQIS